MASQLTIALSARRFPVPSVPPMAEHGQDKGGSVGDGVPGKEGLDACFAYPCATGE